MAWPNPTWLLVAGLSNYVILTIAANRFRFTPAHLLALPSLLAAYLAATALASSIDMLALEDTTRPHRNGALGSGVGLSIGRRPFSPGSQGG